MDVDTIGRRSGRGKTLALVYPRSNWQHDRRCPTQPIPRRDFRARRRSLNAMVHDASAATQLMHAHRPMVNTLEIARGLAAHGHCVGIVQV